MEQSHWLSRLRAHREKFKATLQFGKAGAIEVEFVVQVKNAGTLAQDQSNHPAQ
ncbi:MAG TPA: hypothetical protein VGO22_24145 [Pseudorhizobium sp.]|nr:hypothetical protein [Pseudorhizobium sp.]